jgi:hypothetical protein
MNLRSIKKTAWQGLDAAVCHSLFNGIKPAARKTAHRFAESGHKRGYVFGPELFLLNNPKLLGSLVR